MDQLLPTVQPDQRPLANRMHPSRRSRRLRVQLDLGVQMARLRQTDLLARSRQMGLPNQKAQSRQLARPQDRLGRMDRLRQSRPLRDQLGLGVQMVQSLPLDLLDP